MSTSSRHRLSNVFAAGAALAGLLFLPSLVRAQVGSLDPRAAREAPDLLAVANDGTVTQLAMAIVRTGVPTGVYLADGAIDTRGAAPGTGISDARALDEALRVFTSKHSEHGIRRTRQGGVVITQRPPSRCMAASRQGVLSYSGSGSPLELLDRLVRTWNDDRAPSLPPGLIGGDDRDPYLAPVSITVTASTFEDALNALIQQRPGLGWAIQEKRRRAESADEIVECSVDLFTGQTWVTGQTWIPGWLLRHAPPDK